MTGILSTSGNVNTFFSQRSQRANESNAEDSHTLSGGVKEIMKPLQVMLERVIKDLLLLQAAKVSGQDSAPEDLSSELGEAGAVLDGMDFPRYAATAVSWQGQANDAGSNESGALNSATRGSSLTENTWRSVI